MSNPIFCQDVVGGEIINTAGVQQGMSTIDIPSHLSETSREDPYVNIRADVCEWLVETSTFEIEHIQEFILYSKVGGNMSYCTRIGVTIVIVGDIPRAVTIRIRMPEAEAALFRLRWL